MITTRHGRARNIIAAIPAVLLLFTPVRAAPQHQATPPAAVPQTDTCTVDPDGTAHVTRVVPVPQTISPEAQKFISRPGPSGPEPTLAERRAALDKFRSGRAEEARKLYPVDIKEETIGGVRCDVIKPLNIPAAKRNRVLINVHGGGFNSDSGSLVEGNSHRPPHRNIRGFRLLPAGAGTSVPRRGGRYGGGFQGTVEDVQAGKDGPVRHLCRRRPYRRSRRQAATRRSAASWRPWHLFRDRRHKSAGRLPGPLHSSGFSGPLQPPPKTPHDSDYIGTTDPKDPVLAPIYADLKGFPPTLLVTSTRDLLLSGTSDLHRAFLRAGVDAELVVFEALPHAFWYDYQLPETKEALDIMARFFDKKLGE